MMATKLLQGECVILVNEVADFCLENAKPLYDYFQDLVQIPKTDCDMTPLTFNVCILAYVPEVS
jgi:hypothetical protein